MTYGQTLTDLLLHISLIESIGPATLMRVMRAFKLCDSGSLNILYHLGVAELQSVCNLSESQAQVLYKGLADKKLLEQELELIHKYDISIITILDDTYPSLLKAIHLPPIILYTKGSASLSSDRQLAVVGSRKADSYGQKVINMLIPELIYNGWSIVSGGALGIDSMAHQATLQAQGTTIAVLGSGLLKPYPAKHKPIFKKIIDNGGALISSFPLMMEAQPGLFPARNRIIAGLSHGCFVIQAGIPSGALITAQQALNEGREVFAVPGAIDNPLSAGCHKLISEGAILVTSAADILKALGDKRDASSNKNMCDGRARNGQVCNPCSCNGYIYTTH